ncbi:MAG: roadblock/LC7 domain-containing protein [Candidatus Bathyarchaeota archaeon]|nr:roadblock/LC7 domain-containing protein [Candidatus Bathyarchaeota archaeon]
MQEPEETVNNNAYTIALQNTLAELQNACPDITHALIFKDNTLLAKTDNTSQEDANNTLNAFHALTERADSIGGVNAITIQAANGKINITRVNDFQMAAVLTKAADEKYINTLTRTIIPIVIKLIDNIAPAQQEALTVELEPIKETTIEEAEQAQEAEQTEEAETSEETAKEPETPKEEEAAEDEEDEGSTPKPPVTQLIVENLSGLLVRADTVQIDKSLIEDWNELYGEGTIKEVHIEALNGKTTRCKFKPIKDSKQEGKGIIKIPEKIQIELEATQGDLVMVKPVVE